MISHVKRFLNQFLNNFSIKKINIFSFYFFKKISEISEIPMIEKNDVFQFFETIFSIFNFFRLIILIFFSNFNCNFFKENPHFLNVFFYVFGKKMTVFCSQKPLKSGKIQISKKNRSTKFSRAPPMI